MIRKGILLTALILGILMISGPFVSSATAAEPVVVRIGHVGFTGSLFDKTAAHFEKLVDSRSQGEIDVRNFGASQLGKDKEMMQAVRLGNLEMCLPSTVVPAVAPIFAFQELPFLFKDRHHVERALLGPAGAKLNEILEGKGYIILGFWENGFRKITNNKRPIRVPADLKGIKLRVPKSPARVKLFQTLGANPTSMSFKEVFSALQQGVIDGQENPMAQIMSAKMNEVQKYLSLSDHVYTPGYALIGKKFFEGLSPEHQYVLRVAAIDTGNYARKTGKAMDTKLLKEASKTMKINKIDRAAFLKASQSLYDDYPKEFGADGKYILDHILKAAEEK
jgi:tripartite ATP-independent transporter DctP family solute receptor